MRQNMFYGASRQIFQRAEELRARMTSAEEVLWNAIHINDWHVKFRRQHPLSAYIVDFYCHALKLVIELDGGYHEEDETKKNDVARENNIKEFGVFILRFRNEEVEKDINVVLLKIKETINQISGGLAAESSNNSPLGDGGKTAATRKSSKTSPSGAGGLLFIIKIGGNVIDDEQKLSSFLADFAAIGENKILVHGGGKLATRMAEKMGIGQQMLDGRRITDAETLKIVTMVYAGSINKGVVAQLQSFGCDAIGLSGADGNAILSHKRTGTDIDYGFAGDVDAVNGYLLNALLENGNAVVLSPITHDGKGQLLNTNADTIAQETAKAMSSYYDTTLVYCFEKAGVLLNADDESSVINKIGPAYYKQLKDEKKIFAGMIPKLDNAFAALNSGVDSVIIGKAEELAELIKGKSGTTISNE